ncbi:transketolase family protein [Streptomyces albogriseolus]|uniref:transketolase family protein n=1 Tax=Streptomyces TaxID=1883 RepID=UPI002A765139|nr:transketolase C-terminal domain-containing protein [Streptomyces sp. CL7]WPP34301.1 transketolase C-terminal domain-containing protein [Streptomyces sp. CL7]
MTELTIAQEAPPVQEPSWEERYAGSSRDICRRALLGLAREDPRIMCVDADVGGLESLFADLPEQYVNVGIAEANLIGMAAGMAAAGLVPFAHTLSGFAATRACEQIKVDVAGNNLPVRVIVSHGGLSAGHYGPTHHAVDDLGIMRLMPQLTVLVPADAFEAEQALITSAGHPGPVVIRLGRGETPLVHRRPYDFRIGRAVTLADGDDVTLVATGPYPVLMALRAAETLAAEGIGARVLNMHTIKPLDEEAVLRAVAETRGIVTVEDHLVVGGLGGAVCETVAARGGCPVRRIGVPDRFSDRVGGELDLLEHAGVTPERIAAEARQLAGAAR